MNVRTNIYHQFLLSHYIVITRIITLIIFKTRTLEIIIIKAGNIGVTNNKMSDIINITSRIINNKVIIMNINLEIITNNTITIIGTLTFLLKKTGRRNFTFVKQIQHKN